LNELERVEAQAFRDIVTLGGGRAEMVGGALCMLHPLFSQALPVGNELDVEAVLRWYDGAKHTVATPSDLSAHGYTPGYALMKFERDNAPAPVVDTALRIEETRDEATFLRVCAEGMGLTDPPGGFVGAPGFRCFIARDDDEPAACAALYQDGDIAWLGIAVTRPDFRGRGGQRALLSARIEAARETGAHRLTTETGERVPGKPDQSYRNILRAGFREAYLRPTWQSPR